jgi:hypothetical protein
MNRTDAIAWVLTVCSGLRLSQAKTLSELVPAAMRVGRVSLAEIGRSLFGETSVKHRIKRAWRFTNNSGVEVSDAMRGVIVRLLKRHKNKPLLVALDWTDIRNFHTLMAAAVMKGRAIPLLWATYPKWRLHKSQNNLEEGLLRLLRDMIPTQVQITLLADRGFGRAELGRLCQSLGFHYIIRIKPDVWVRAERFRGKLLDYPVKKGMCRMLRRVEYRKQNPLTQNVVVRWKKGLPKRRDECWFRMTDLDQSPLRLSELYGKRMTVEELFRDDKNRRNGFALRNIQIKRADRIDRLLLILALAYILLVGIGLRAQQQYPPAMWCSSNSRKQCSVFTIGRVLQEQLEIPPPVALAAVALAIIQAAPNWG